MNLIGTLIVWSWLLGISFVVPTTLPAGGAKKTIIEYSENYTGSPLIALKEFNLLSSASHNSSFLTRVNAGTPINVLKVWDSSESEKWLLVKVLYQDFYQLFYKRGWVNTKTS
tara:strand:+ start:37 stop:375 length:339 start_codon:yes stop_codon:yes gene_type:complete